LAQRLRGVKETPPPKKKELLFFPNLDVNSFVLIPPRVGAKLEVLYIENGLFNCPNIG